MSTSVAAKRAAYQNTKRCDLMCLECCGEVAGGSTKPCTFPVDSEPFRFQIERDGNGKTAHFMACTNCFLKNRVCHALPLGDYDNLVAMKGAFDNLDAPIPPIPESVDSEADPEDLDERTAQLLRAHQRQKHLKERAPGLLQQTAIDIYEQAKILARDGGFGSHFQLHNGECQIETRCAQSGIMKENRDRSKHAVARKRQQGEDFVAGRTDVSPKKAKVPTKIVLTDIELDGRPSVQNRGIAVLNLADRQQEEILEKSLRDNKCKPIPVDDPFEGVDKKKRGGVSSRLLKEMNERAQIRNMFDFEWIPDNHKRKYPSVGDARTALGDEWWKDH